MDIGRPAEGGEMKIGDLVRCRPRDPTENYDAWLGLIIAELPGYAEYKKVQWVNSEEGGALETVSHKVKDLEVVSESR